jgi:polar amino acid transport system substrate-binding protein
VIVAGVGNKATNYTDSDLTQITLLMAGMWRLIQRRREEEAERERQEQFAQADKLITLGMLVSGVAHEINNPNNFIMLNAPIVKTAWYGFKPILDRFYEREGDFSAGGFPYSQLRDILGNLLDDIREGAVRIKHIVAELKDYARPASHDADQPVAVNEVIRGAVTLLTNHIRKRTRRFHVEYGRDLPQVRGNFQKVEQMLINLIENACDSLEHEDQAVYVRSGYDEPCERVYIEVEDQGCGIPPENLKRIMDPFFTTKRDIGGMGLGLSIVDRIVKDHAAEIRFSPAPGRGTLVQVFMRLAPRPHESPYRENQEKP